MSFSLRSFFGYRSIYCQLGYFHRSVSVLLSALWLFYQFGIRRWSRPGCRSSCKVFDSVLSPFMSCEELVLMPDKTVFNSFSRGPFRTVTFICMSLEKLYSGPAHFLIRLFLLLVVVFWVVWDLYIYLYLNLLLDIICKIFLILIGCFFILVIFLLCRSFFILYNSICLFLLLFSLPQ